MVQEIVVFMINLFVDAILSVPFIGEHSWPNPTNGAKKAKWYFLSRLYFVNAFATKICMKNLRLGSFSIAIEHKIQKWFAIEISKMSAIN